MAIPGKKEHRYDANDHLISGDKPNDHPLKGTLSEDIKLSWGQATAITGILIAVYLCIKFFAPGVIA